MRRIEASVEIQAPVADVFAFASDWQRWEDWWEGVSQFRPTTEVTRGNGTRYAYKAWIAGMTSRLTFLLRGRGRGLGQPTWGKLVPSGLQFSVFILLLIRCRSGHRIGRLRENAVHTSYPPPWAKKPRAIELLRAPKRRRRGHSQLVSATVIWEKKP